MVVKCCWLGETAHLVSDDCPYYDFAFLTILKGGVQKGVRSSLVLASNPSRSPGRYCICFSRVLTGAVSWARLRLARLASDLFRCDHSGSHRIQLVRVWRQLEDRQPVASRWPRLICCLNVDS